MLKYQNVSDVIAGYKEAIFFTELYSEISENDYLSDTAESRIEKDCEEFCILIENHPYILENENAIDFTKIGHDFWLTRNHHGAGFWDGGWAEIFGDFATAISHKFSDIDVYSENGLIYFY